MRLVYYPNLTKKNFDKAINKSKTENFYLEKVFLKDLYYDIKKNKKDLMQTEFFKDLEKDLTRWVAFTLEIETYKTIKKQTKKRKK